MADRDVSVTGRWVVLVARTTSSGVDHRWVDALATDVRAAVDDPVNVAYLDQADPSVHAVLDDAVECRVGQMAIVPLAVPSDVYLTTWIARAVANWRESRAPTDLDVRLCDGLSASPALAAAVAELAHSEGAPITASPAAFRSPTWSVIPEHSRHVLVCRGPRCTATARVPRTMR